jgi:hypothetical protein
MANILDLTWLDLEAGYEGELDPERDAYYDRKLDQAVRLLFNTCASLKRRMDAGEVDVDSIKDVVFDAVYRVLRNPLGIKKEGEGDYDYEVSPTVASGDVWFTDKDYKSIGCGKDKPPVAKTVRSKLTPGWAF